MKYILLIMGLFIAVLAGCGREEAPAAIATKTWQLPILVVTSGAPIEHTGIGSVVSDQRVEVASRLSGYIRELRVQEGDQVRIGDLLARIDSADVEGNIQQAQSALSAAESALKDTRIDVERFQSLFEKGNVSDSEMRKVKLRQDISQESATQARTALKTAQAQRDYTEIRSPIDGVVVSRERRAGDLATPGVPIITLESAGGLLFETFLAEKQVSQVRVGMPVTVRIDGFATPLTGIVSRVVASGDPVTRSYPVKVALPATAGLLPGMFGRADFVIGETAVPVVPTAALVERGGLRGVFVIDADNKARFRWLRLGREWPERAEVTAGLQPGERIVAVAEPALREGDAVSVVAAAAGITKQKLAP